MEHVLGRAPRVAGCLFEPPGAAPFDRDHLLLFRNELCVVLLNRFPYANGHLLLAPRRHVADPEELDDRENLALMRMVGQCCAILRRHLRPHGINVGLNLGAAADAGIDRTFDRLQPDFQALSPAP
jgi:ATP adenylyltransferase